MPPWAIRAYGLLRETADREAGGSYERPQGASVGLGVVAWRKCLIRVMGLPRMRQRIYPSFSKVQRASISFGTSNRHGYNLSAPNWLSPLVLLYKQPSLDHLLAVPALRNTSSQGWNRSHDPSVLSRFQNGVPLRALCSTRALANFLDSPLRFHLPVEIARSVEQVVRIVAFAQPCEAQANLLQNGLPLSTPIRP